MREKKFYLALDKYECGIIISNLNEFEAQINRGRKIYRCS